ncbi:hypothetical protein MLD38_012405 [Melastoma candidum]|uniref:Uncharacterized protein n=1 Tax=Melastoma candidum TaxID=119954 RepID=A0ACB9R9U5_9MYRT|nr:hypothetical protein MLD38_012405 [Melastoma candidum]
MEMAIPQVNRELLKELEEMGFQETTAIEALRYVGNANLEAAIDWLISRGNELNIAWTTPGVLADIEIGSPGPDFITEEMNTKARELRDRAAKSTNGERILNLQRNKEKDRIQASKELAEVRRVAEEKERARYLTAKKAEKEEERRAREIILQKLENDKRERRRKPWSTMEESPVAWKSPVPAVNEKKHESILNCSPLIAHRPLT